MDSVLNFLADYYFVFLGVSVVLLIALIGFIAGSRKKKPEVQTASETAQPNMTQTEPMGVQMDAFAPVAPETPAPVTPEAVAPVEQPVVNDINAGMPLPPEEPVKSDEPTLIIEDKSATPAPTEQSSIMEPPATPPAQSLFEVPNQQTAEAARQSLFEVPNNTNQNM